MVFSSLPEFDRELKRLLKKYRTLKEDLSVLKSYLEKYPRGFEPIVFPISNLGISTPVYKVKHFHCKTMKSKGSRSGIRIIYAYFEKEQKIDFVEIYYKEKDDRDCDRERIFRYYR
jgi:hypothetical protein